MVIDGASTPWAWRGQPVADPSHHPPEEAIPWSATRFQLKLPPECRKLRAGGRCRYARRRLSWNLGRRRLPDSRRLGGGCRLDSGACRSGVLENATVI